jgi:hypothetical protein
MGSMFIPACKVLDQMAEREIFLNFENSFGGSQTYIPRNRKVVVGFNLVKNCKMEKVG